MESRKTAFAKSTISNHLLEVGVYKISSHTRCLSVVSWILRFADSSRKRKEVNTSSPSADELRRAMHCIAWNLQTNFNEEFNLLQRGNNFELIKVGECLEHANIPDSQKHKILLPRLG